MALAAGPGGGRLTTVLSARALSKWYGDVIALNDVTVDVPGGLTGLLGPNGAGKSTLLHLSIGLLRPSKGELTLLGEDPWGNTPLLGRVGLVPETLALWESMRGVEHAAMAARLHGASKADGLRAARATLERVDLAAAADRRVGTYSRGMRQRLKIAMGLIHAPELLLLDEPFTGLDPLGRRSMIELLRALARDGVHVVFSSHVLHEVEALTRNIVVLVSGHVVALGDVHEIRSLMDRFPHHVRFVVDRPRELARLLVGFDDVVRVRVDEHAGEVEAETRSPETFYGRVQKVLLEHRFRVDELTSPDDNLQAVFRYLTQGGAA